MDIVYIVLVTLFGFTCLTLLIYQVRENRREKIENKNEIKELEAELNRTEEDKKFYYDKLEQRNQEIRQYHSNLIQWQERYDTIATEKLNVEQELIQLQSSIQVEAVKNDSKESLEAELENLKALAVEKMSELQQITANTQKLAESQNEKLEEIAKLEAGMKALEGRISSGREVLENLEGEIKSTNDHLCELARLKASVLKVEEGVGSVWELTPGMDKKRLIELIHELVETYGDTYPILRKELLKVEWSTVWLPQLQQLCVRENLDRSGIYKITDKNDDRVVYIGQAVSIKERWYTHCKKMLGVEAKGLERIYDYRPDEVTWEVVEFKDGNLDSDEKYWIDYFKCREIGLNKKR